MADDKPLGRVVPELSEADKARIRAEEEYRASLRAELTAPPVPQVPKPKRTAATPDLEVRLAAERALQDKEALPGAKKRNPFLMTEPQRAVYDQVKRERLPPEERARQNRNNRVALSGLGVVLLICGGILLKSCGTDYLQSREAARNRAAAEAAAALTLGGQSPYTIKATCEENVRNKLKAPSTAAFAGDTLPAYNGTAWTWTSAVDAQNSFGAQIRTAFICTVNGSTPDDAQVSTALLN